ncbi:MAG: nucleoside hydrolase [Peptostreptococcaceae bacterium]
MEKKVIIDCDPGIDDSLAILLAVNSPELEILGITTCSGNVEAKMGAGNALKALQMCSSLNIPVYIGEESPLKRELVSAQDTHGEDGVGENFYEKVTEAKIKDNGVDFIIDTLKNNDNVSIIALRPLTNIAKELIKDKEAFENLDEFVSMGGAFRIHPNAANYVYKNLPKKIHMIGLDIVDSFDFYKKEKNAVILTDVDDKKFMHMFLKRIFKEYEEIIDSVEGVI